ncbi:MAG: EAL domain-containing protein [Candidatus Tyrphobacter sp.]
MVLSSERRASFASWILAAATFTVVVFFIVVAARRPGIVQAKAAAVEQVFDRASSLQTLRLYVENVRIAQEELLVERSPASRASFARARDWFAKHLRTVGSANPALAHRIGRSYDAYVRDTLEVLRGDRTVTPAVLTHDYATLEALVYQNSMLAYRGAYGAQARYDAFKSRNDLERLGFCLLVAITTLVLLGLSQLYRSRLDRVSRERIAMLSHAALNDALTGLRNLRAFEDDLPKAAAVAQRFNHPISLVLLDVDRFKEANDRAGHAIGDALLKDVAKRLGGLREADGAYRLGGDEFALVLPGTNGAGAEVLALRLVAEPFALPSVKVTVSAGVANLRVGESLGDWRERADIALYEAKRRGGEAAVLFENIEAQTHFVNSQAVSRIRDLLVRGAMDVALQPIWDVEAKKILAYEALARPPAEFRFDGPQDAFDAALRIGRTMDLDMLCIRSALAVTCDRAAGVPVFVNVTPATLEHPLVEATSILALLKEYELDSSRVVFEITEGAIRDLDTLVRRADALRNLGIRICADDAGTGTSGMTLLSSLTFDFVKIDHTLLLEAASAKRRGVLTGILAIADAMGADVIAEGVETPELLEFARNLHRIVRVQSGGVQGLQGYLLGRPEIMRAGLRSALRH